MGEHVPLSLSLSLSLARDYRAVQLSRASCVSAAANTSLSARCRRYEDDESDDERRVVLSKSQKRCGRQRIGLRCLACVVLKSLLPVVGKR